MAQAAPQIPDHELLRPIGRGSYGEVWLARSATGAYRAVKVVCRDSFDHDRPYEREFAGIKQYEPISRASDTQVDILHVGRNDEFFYYVMELADDQKTGQKINPAEYKARTLRSELHERGRLPLAECLEIGIQLTSALEHLHKNGLVHRDVKPSNIVFINGKPKLADPGLVVGLDATKSRVGTEGYMPMEGPGTPASDLFSLGKVLYEMSSARDRMDYPELASDLRARPDREGLVQLNEVILKACDEDCKLRYQTAASMRADLERVKAGQPIARARRWGKRELSMAVILGLAALTLGLFKWFPGTATSGGSQPKDRETNRVGSILAAPGTNESSLAAGLVSWWKADGTSQDSAGTHHGTLVDGASFAIGIDGQAFFFNGHSACVSVPYTPAWAFGRRDFAIALWAKFSTVADDQAFLACENRVAGSNQSRCWRFCLHQGLLQWQMDGRSGHIWLGKARFNPAVETWRHLAMTRSGPSFRFYIDGAEVASEVWNGEVPDVKAPLTIGNAWGGDSFNGLLDDIRIYNRTLTAAEISTLAQASDAKNSNDRIAVGTHEYQRSEFIVNTSLTDVNAQGNLAVLANGNFLVA